uniref:TauD/TfdA-like domain-containing protein n=1 Tax=Psilocybe cubensis TaxID=181762 RepID=A0A8H7XNF0_PSICU
MSVPSFLGSLANFAHYDATPHIGTVFSDASVQLSQLLAAPNADVLIKDLATLVSQRGVVFFKAQDIDIETQKLLATRLGELTGKPADSKLHRHPLTEDGSELGDDVQVISSAVVFPRERALASRGWHSDVTFEPVPSDYAWASAYEAYDRLSPAYQKFLEGLTAVHDAEQFHVAAKLRGFEIPAGPRGSPLNVGSELTAVHPVIRTNPVTGFKGLFVNKNFTKRIVELTSDESADVLNYLAVHVAENHDLQVRYRWEKNDVAIWDNRSTFHTATPDYDGLRVGNRVVSVGEKPFFDPASKSRREALGIKSKGL